MPSAFAASGLLLDIVGAVILALGLVVKPPEALVDESTPRYDFSAALDASLARQKADAQVGATMLVLGFTVQMASALGWHYTDWTAVGVGLAAAAVVAAGGWAFLIYLWRPRTIRAMLGARLRSSDLGLWWPVLAIYGDLLGQPHTVGDETIASYGERLLGPKAWSSVTRGIVLPNVMTKPRSEIPGTPEYEKAHGR